MTKTAPAMNYDDAQFEPARAVLERIEAELCDIAHAIDRNQALIASAAANIKAGPVVLRAVQEADLLSQKVAGIADFIAALNGGLPDDLQIDTGPAMAGVRLAELADRLAGAGAGRAIGDKAGLGDCDLF